MYATYIFQKTLNLLLTNLKLINILDGLDCND